VLSQGRSEKEGEDLRSHLQHMLKPLPTTTSAGELALQDNAGRSIHASIFARAR